MANPEAEGKTEKPTGSKLGEARRKGNVAKSRELTGIVPVWVMLIYFSFSGAMLTTLVSYLRSSLTRGFKLHVNDVTLMQVFTADLAQVGVMMLPIFGFIVLGIMTVHFLQTGFLFTTEPLTPDLSKLNPFKGIGSLFSINAIFEFMKGVMKIAVLGVVLYLTINKEMLKIPSLIDMEMSGIVNFSLAQLKTLILTSAIVLTIFALIDYVYQKWQYIRNLKMTKMEVKDEARQSEGDPQVKARIRSLQREMARKRMMQEVPKADVVITNPTHFAVALKYDSANMGAPTVVAKGANLIAARIREIAQQHGVPIFEDKPLARTLFKLDLGQEIPETLYKALATILANVYKLKGKVRK